MGSLRQGGRLPDVINIGGMKCGTTSLFHYMRAHPEVGTSRFKQTYFFNDQGKLRSEQEGNWHKGLDWYRREWPNEGRVIFEGMSLGYSDWPIEEGIPERIATILPKARFIYMVRNPVDRAVSHWMNSFAKSMEHRPIEEALLSDIDDYRVNPYIRRGLYAMQLNRYLQQFEDISRFLIVTFEEFRDQHRETLQEIFRFIGVDADYWTDKFNIIHHPASLQRRKNAVGMFIQRTIGERIYYRLRSYQRYWMETLLYRAFSKLIERPVLPPEVRKKLQDRFAADIEELSGMTGRSFHSWVD